MRQVEKVSVVMVCIILLGTGCSLLADKAKSEPCSHSPFVSNLSEYLGQTQLRIGYYSQGSFFAANLDGENKVTWADGVYPIWSPDRKNIAYRESNSICFANYDGSQIREVAHGANLRGLSWSPDGKFMVYSALEDDNQYEIYIVSLTGEITQLTFSLETGELTPVWSPDSKEIAFVTYSDPVDTGGYIEYTVTISILNTISKQIRAITLDGLEPRWSPDGTKLLFESVDDRICVIDSDGRNKSCLTSGFTDYGAEWSPDGKQIAFTRIDKGWSIFTMNSDGSNQTWLANGIFPVWSPDGNRIAYGTGGETWYVYVIDINGADKKLIAKNAPGYTWIQP